MLRGPEEGPIADKLSDEMHFALERVVDIAPTTFAGLLSLVELMLVDLFNGHGSYGGEIDEAAIRSLRQGVVNVAQAAGIAAATLDAALPAVPAEMTAKPLGGFDPSVPFDPRKFVVWREQLGYRESIVAQPDGRNSWVTQEPDECVDPDLDAALTRWAFGVAATEQKVRRRAIFAYLVEKPTP